MGRLSSLDLILSRTTTYGPFLSSAVCNLGSEGLVIQFQYSLLVIKINFEEKQHIISKMFHPFNICERQTDT